MFGEMLVFGKDVSLSCSCRIFWKEGGQGRKSVRKFICSSTASWTARNPPARRTSAWAPLEQSVRWHGTDVGTRGDQASLQHHIQTTKHGDVRMSFPMSFSLLHPKWINMDNYNKQFHIRMLISNHAPEYSPIIVK